MKTTYNQIQKNETFVSCTVNSKKAVVSLLLFRFILMAQVFFIGSLMAETKDEPQKHTDKSLIEHNRVQKGETLMSNSLNSKKKEVKGNINEKTPLRFIFITPFVDIDFFLPVKKGMADAAKEMGVLCEFTGPKDGDTQSQAKMVRQAIADGYDGIALNIIDSAGLTNVIDEAVNAGIPVVAFNVDDQNVPTRRLSAVCQNLFEAGKVLAKESYPFIAEGSKILILMHDKGVSALDQRCRGIIEGLQGKNVKWDIIVTGSAEKTVQIVTERLKAEPDIKVLLCTGQSDTEGAGFAIEKNFKGRADYKVAGFDLSKDTLRMVKEGTISFVIDQQPYMQGYYPVIQLTHYCRFGIVPSNVDTGYNIINQKKAAMVIEHSKNHYR